MELNGTHLDVVHDIFIKLFKFNVPTNINTPEGNKWCLEEYIRRMPIIRNNINTDKLKVLYLGVWMALDDLVAKPMGYTKEEVYNLIDDFVELGLYKKYIVSEDAQAVS